MATRTEIHALKLSVINYAMTRGVTRDEGWKIAEQIFNPSHHVHVTLADLLAEVDSLLPEQPERIDRRTKRGRQQILEEQSNGDEA
jgi:hypothetical protein